MKKSVKWIVIVLIAAAAFVCVYFIYQNLKEKYTPAQFSEVTQSDQQEEMDDPDENEAPDFTVYDENGQAVNLSDYFGKPVVLNFWASWCYYCKEEMPYFNEAYMNYPDVQFLMINVTDGNQETMESAGAFLEENDYAFPVLYDTDLDAACTYGAYGLPMTVFIDRDGNIVTYANGMLSRENLEKGIRMILE